MNKSIWMRAHAHTHTHTFTWSYAAAHSSASSPPQAAFEIHASGAPSWASRWQKPQKAAAHEPDSPPWTMPLVLVRHSGRQQIVPRLLPAETAAYGEAPARKREDQYQIVTYQRDVRVFVREEKLVVAGGPFLRGRIIFWRCNVSVWRTRTCVRQAVWYAHMYVSQVYARRLVYVHARRTCRNSTHTHTHILRMDSCSTRADIAYVLWQKCWRNLQLEVYELEMINDVMQVWIRILV